MEAFLTQEHLALREKLRRLAQEEIGPRAEEEADVEGQAHTLLGLMAREGILSLVVPQAYGGAYPQVQAISLCLAREELARVSSLADTMFAMQGLGSYPITLAGSEEQRGRYLPPIPKGEKIAAFALTEPGSGSDVLGMESTARFRDGAYYLNGVKSFISNAGIADLYVVFVKTDPAKGGKGISAFVLEEGVVGFSLVRRMRLIAPHPIGEVAFHDCRLDKGHLLSAEGDGLRIALQTLELFRISVGAAAVGMAQRALEEALRYAQERVQFGKPLAEFQALRFKLAEMATELEAGRLLVHSAAWKWDQGVARVTLEASMAKLYATEMAQRVVDQALQIHGARGVLQGSVVERLYREVRALRIYEGTSEIQQMTIANQLLKG